jgi:acyl-coenzyme A thioesterase PaaI-like protein
VSSLQDVARIYERHNPRCIGCGEANAVSLGFHIAFGPDGIAGRLRFGDEHEGGIGLVHGGMLAVALDEALGRAACVLRRAHCVTARLELDFAVPAVIGEYEVRIREDSHEGRKTWMAGEVVREGVVHAAGRGLFIAVAPPVDVGT